MDTHTSDMVENKAKELTHKRIVLVGKGASGKDYARVLFANKNFKYAVSYTTRPPRPGEIQGDDYIFLSVEQFRMMIENHEFYEYVTFNGWYYGTSNAQFYRDDLFIMTPSGVSKIHPEDRKNTMVIYFDIPEHVRRERLMKRADADKVDRRLAADCLDFEGFTDYDIRIENANF